LEFAVSDRGIAVVTGAGGGIGRAAAIALAGAGFDLVLAGRRSEALEETAGMCRSGATCIATDVRDPASVNALFAAVGALERRLDVLFNNAGMDVPGVPFEEVAFETWSNIFSTNVTGQFLCAQGAYRLMLAQSPKGGRIINNGSVSAQAPRPNSIPYATSKSAITGLTRGISLDGRRHGIAASQIDVGNAAADPAQVRAPAMQASGQTMLEPFMPHAEVARAVAYLATLPEGTNVPFLTIMATNMPLLGRG